MSFFFFEKNGDFTAKAAESLVSEALQGADDGELYLEHTVSENLVWTDGKLRTASYDVDQGFGLRAVAGEFTAYAHASDLSLKALKQAANTVTTARAGYNGHLSLPASGRAASLYPAASPIDAMALADKIALLQKIDAYVRQKDSEVVQVAVTLATEYKQIAIVRPDADPLQDARPLSRLNITVTVRHGERTEEGSHGLGGREVLSTYLTDTKWQQMADFALRQARVNLTSIPAPAGQMSVVLGPGWPGVLFHEAVGHGLEGDFNRKGVSMFSGKIGSRVAAPGVTVVDEGNIAGRRGSLSFDDEGTPTQRNVLIEDGILKGYMQDRMNARLMQMAPTGNGRRESYASMPMPRMTNTFLDNGDRDPAEILASVKDGIYATDFGGGQVDIVSGKFVFEMKEAYRIENGRIGAPLKGATLIGSGHESLHHISMIGNDLALDNGIGTCGKGGQSVPAGIGQPTLRIDNMTVGGAG